MTLTELAHELGLSPSTISRALSRPDLVAEATRQKVLMAVKAYGYTPNAIARSLRKGETRTIGVVVSDIENPFYSAVVRAVECVAANHGYSCVICNADENADKEAQALSLLNELRVSGIIHASTGTNLITLHKLQNEGLPIVDIDRASGLKGVDTVLVDNALGARLAATHLLELGHKRNAVITGPLHLTTGHDRLKGFQDALEAAGESLPGHYIEIGDFREASGYRATLALLELPTPPTALFVTNNEMMAGALAALRERGLRIPQDMSLISFDDVRWAKYVEPPLTIIAQPTEQLGVKAAKLLFERLQGRLEPITCVLAPELVKRGSCAFPLMATPLTRVSQGGDVA